MLINNVAQSHRKLSQEEPGSTTATTFRVFVSISIHLMQDVLLLCEDMDDFVFRTQTLGTSELIKMNRPKLKPKGKQSFPVTEERVKSSAPALTSIGQCFAVTVRGIAASLLFRKEVNTCIESLEQPLLVLPKHSLRLSKPYDGDSYDCCLQYVLVWVVSKT